MLPQPLTIGPWAIDPPLVLAPMAGITDKPFRELCRSSGAGLAVCEMLTAERALWDTPKSRFRMNHAGEQGPVSVQIAGADPDMLAAAARHNVALGADIIDINMGCPAKKVCKRWAGSALLQDERLVARILETVVGAVDVPVTLKIRTGWDRNHVNGVRIARIAEQCGVRALAVHGRTRDMRFEGNAEYETIAAIKSSVDIPVLANGDIGSPEQACRVLAQTGADGLMIGRGAQGRPWIFAEIAHYLTTGRIRPAPAIADVGATMRAHVEAVHGFYGERAGVRIARKHLGWYAHALEDPGAFKLRVFAAESANAQLRLACDHFG
jgi:tRNA-dihydrouridine synthase B